MALERINPEATAPRSIPGDEAPEMEPWGFARLLALAAAVGAVLAVMAMVVGVWVGAELAGWVG